MRATVRTWLVLALCVAMFAVIVAQAPDPEIPKPTLTEVQKLQILNAAKDLEIAQLRLDAARAVMQTLVTALTPPGFQITSKLDLEPVPAPTKDSKEK